MYTASISLILMYYPGVYIPVHKRRDMERYGALKGYVQIRLSMIYL